LGNQTYNWDLIQTVFERSATQITPAQYLAMAELMSEMNTAEFEKGVQAIATRKDKMDIAGKYVSWEYDAEKMGMLQLLLEAIALEYSDKHAEVLSMSREEFIAKFPAFVDMTQQEFEDYQDAISARAKDAMQKSSVLEKLAELTIAQGDFMLKQEAYTPYVDRLNNTINGLSEDAYPPIRLEMGEDGILRVIYWGTQFYPGQNASVYNKEYSFEVGEVYRTAGSANWAVADTEEKYFKKKYPLSPDLLKRLNDLVTSQGRDAVFADVAEGLFGTGTKTAVSFSYLAPVIAEALAALEESRKNQESFKEGMNLVALNRGISTAYWLDVYTNIVTDQTTGQSYMKFFITEKTQKQVDKLNQFIAANPDSLDKFKKEFNITFPSVVTLEYLLMNPDLIGEFLNLRTIFESEDDLRRVFWGDSL
jgi:hypothetical protein